MIQIEIPKDALIATRGGVTRLATIMEEASYPNAWAIKWRHNGEVHSISFHKSHPEARKFLEMQVESVHADKPKLIDVSQTLRDEVDKKGSICTNLTDFESAKYYS